MFILSQNTENVTIYKLQFSVLAMDTEKPLMVINQVKMPPVIRLSNRVLTHINFTIETQLITVRMCDCVYIVFQNKSVVSDLFIG